MEENRKTAKNSSLNKTWLLVTGLVILTAVLLVISLNTKSLPGLPSVTEEVKKDFAYTSLIFSDEPRPSTISGTFDLDININTDKNEVTGVQLELDFDPKALTRVDIRAGDFLINRAVLIKNIDIKNGRVTYAIGNRPGQAAVKGAGVIAVLSFSKVSGDQTSINFLPHTAVSAPGYNQSVLRETVSAVIGAPPSPTSVQTFLSPIPTQ